MGGSRIPPTPATTFLNTRHRRRPRPTSPSHLVSLDIPHGRNSRREIRKCEHPAGLGSFDAEAADADRYARAVNLSVLGCRVFVVEWVLPYGSVYEQGTV